MAKNRLLLGSVAFGVSFCLSLLVNRDIKTAFVTGSIAVPATFSGVFAVNGKPRIKHQSTVTALQAQIYQLEEWEFELNQSLLAIATEEHRIRNNISFLKRELSQLYTQIAEQRSYKQQLSQDLTTLNEQRHQLEAELQELQNQIQKFEQCKEELEQSLRSLKAKKQNAEADFNSAQAELKQLHVQIQVLEKSKAELEQSLSALAQDNYTTEVNLRLLQSQLSQMQLKVEQKQQEKLPDEWNEFKARLTKFEIQVLEAIIQQSEPSAAIKKIAEENVTMPELLIDSINERALDTIGDLIVEPGSETLPPVVPEEYLTNVNKLLKINEMN